MSKVVRKPVTHIEPKDCPEVLEFIEADRAIQSFIEGNAAWYEQLQQLVADRNMKLENAEKVVRSTSKTCGPFVKLSETTKINAEKLFEEVGSSFADMGGYTETYTKYNVDRARFLAMVDRGDVPEEVRDAVLRVENRYTVPNKYDLP